MHCIGFCIVLGSELCWLPQVLRFVAFSNFNLSILQLFYKCFICMNERSKRTEEKGISFHIRPEINI